MKWWGDNNFKFTIGDALRTLYLQKSTELHRYNWVKFSKYNGVIRRNDNTSVATSRGGCSNSIESGINLKSNIFDDLSNSIPSQVL